MTNEKLVALEPSEGAKHIERRLRDIVEYEDTAVQKAAKLESLHTEQLRHNQVLSDRTSTLEGENALLTNKVSDVNEQLQL